MGKINVLVLITSFIRFKGDDSFTFEYMKRVAKKNVKYDVVVPHDIRQSKGFERVEGLDIHRFQYFFPMTWQKIAYHGGAAYNLSKNTFAKFQLPFFMASFFFKGLANVRGKDLIHAQWLPSALVAVILKKLTGKPYVMWVQRMVYGKGLMRWLNHLVLRNCAYVMFNSSYTKKEALKQFTPKKYGILHIGIDLERFKQVPKEKVRKRLGLSPNSKIILTIGRFVEKKGFEYLIEAMKDIKDKNALLLIGGYGPERKDLEALVKENKLEEKVKFVGRLKNRNLKFWISAADILVVPSIVDSKGETETLGLVAVEAIACSRPIIASAVGGLVDVVKDGYNGFLVKEKNSSQLSEKINLLLKDDALRAKFGKNARKHAEDVFAWNKLVSQTLDIYSQVLKK